MKNKNNDSNSKYKISIGIVVTLVLLYFVLGQLFKPNEHESYYYQSFTTGWKLASDTLSSEDISIPYKTKLKADEALAIKTKIPESLAHNTSIVFWNEFDKVDVLIDGDVRLKYDKRGNRFRKNVGPLEYVTIDLNSEDAGKEITLMLYSGANATFVIDKIYIGDKLGIWYGIIEYNLPTIVIVFLAIVLAVICFFVSMYFERAVTNVVPLKYISLATLLMSIWVLANSEAHQLIFPSVSVICDIAYIVPSFIAMEFLAYMNLSQNRRYDRLFHFAEAYSIIDCIIYNVLAISGVFYYSEIFLPMISSVILAIAIIAGTIIMDIKKKQIKQYTFAALSISVISVAGLLQIVFYITKTAAAYTGIVIAAALFIMMAIALIGTLNDMLLITRERDEAIYASKSKAQFLANMSHEIRTPINAVLGMNEIILKSSKEPETLSCATDIQSAGKSLLSLINDILDFSKIESGKLEIIPVHYEISSLLNDSYNLLFARANSKNLKLEMSCNQDMPHALFGDEVRIRQIIVNLLTNGIKYTDTGKVSLNVDYEKINDNSVLLKISVSDTGKGISKENQQKLFNSFQRVDETNNRNIEGTGLGLSITKQLTDLMYGSISVESELGKGSVFSVNIPQIVKSWGKVGALKLHSAASKEINVHHIDFRAPDAKILIVDDLAINLKVMQGLLRETDISIDTAASGKEALLKVCNTKYDLILLDHMMPEMDGVETFKQMKTQPDNMNKDTPVIMLTANAISGARDEYIAEGFDNYLSKPVESIQLDKLLQEYLSEKITKDVPPVETESDDSLNRFSFLNLEKGLEYCGGMEDIFLDVIGVFARSDKRADIQSYYDAGDWRNYQILVHGLKGSSRMIGADELSDQAFKLETAAKNADYTTIHNEHNNLMNMYGELIEKLNCL